MFINVIQEFNAMGLWSWLWNLLSGKSRYTEGREAKLESIKAKLRVKEDKVRARQAKIERKERRNVGKEVKELGNISRGEAPKKGIKDVVRLLRQDRKVEKEELKEGKQASRIIKEAEEIVALDSMEIQQARSGATGQQSSRVAQLQQDILAQRGVMQQEENEKKVDRQLIGLNEEKGKLEKAVLYVENLIKELGPKVEQSSDSQLSMRVKKLLIRRQQLLDEIKLVEQQILRWEKLKIA